MNRLVLWDIDRTLVTIGGVSRDLFAHALSETTGRGLEQMPDMAGKTDRELVSVVLSLHGVPADDAIVERFFAELAVAAELHADDMRSNGQALAGAAAALRALAEIAGITQTVVTGNIEPIARQKLSLFDLADPIDFEVGGYGSDSVSRAELVRVSRDRASSKYDLAFLDGCVVVVGDTPHDIVGALACGVVAIGVATGSSSEADLKEAGAHTVLSSLVDTAAVLTAVTTIPSGFGAA